MEGILMRYKPLPENLFGISSMYDAVFFIIMVSLAGAILLPVLQETDKGPFDFLPALVVVDMVPVHVGNNRNIRPEQLE